MKAFRRTLSVLLSICMVVTMMVPAFAVQSAGQTQENVDTTSVSAVDGYDYSIVMVDAGRKYYSVDSLKSIIDSASSAGMHYVMLGLGNDGLRFLLDDMSLTVGDTTYTSEAVSTAIHTGNEAYSDFEVDELTEKDMDEIMSYAGTKGVEIIPLINTPGHMDAILDTAEALTGVDCAYGSSQRTIDVTNETATAFTQALLQKYITYFANKGCTLFNMGCDEYANDNNASGGMGFGALVSNGQYSYFVEYVNEVSAMVKDAGMTPMAFNDGIYYKNTTSAGTFDKDIIICYWSSGWWGYDVAKPAFLAEQGHKMVNTHGDWYWIVGGSKCTADKASQFDINSFMGGTIEDPVGAMFCIWSDYPQVQTDTSVAEEVADVIAAFGSALPETSERNTHTGAENSTVVDESTDIAVTAPGVTSVKIVPVENATAADGYDAAVAYEITVNNGDYTDAATVRIPYSDVFAGCDEFIGYADGDAFSVTLKDGYFEGAVPHFSTITISGRDSRVIPNETIALTIGGTASRTLEGELTVMDGYDANVVKVERQVTPGTPESVTYAKVSLRCSELIGRDSSSWVATGYYYKAGNDYYPLYATRSSGLFTVTYNWGYQKGDGSIQWVDSQDVFMGIGSTVNIDVYSQTVVPAVPGETTVTFTGIGFGTTDVTVGSTVYRIVVGQSVQIIDILVEETKTVNVSGELDATNLDTSVATVRVDGNQMTVRGLAKGSTSVMVGSTVYLIQVTSDDISGVEPLTIEFWITNRKVTADGGTSMQVSAADVHAQAGKQINQLIPDTGSFENNVMAYWKTTCLDRNHHQTEGGGVDQTRNGSDFNYIRYWSGAWEYSSNGSTWTEINGTDQIVAYYLQVSNVTQEVQTQVVDWGVLRPQWNDLNSNRNKYVLVDYSVKYPDGTENPKSFPTNNSIGFHCAAGTSHDGVDYRSIGMVRAVETGDYEVYMITVTPTSDDPYDRLASTAAGNSHYSYDGTEQVAWAANQLVLTDSGLEEYSSITGEFQCQIGGDPIVQGLEIYQQQGVKVTYYVRAKVTQDSLTVHYVDQTAGVEFYNYNIAVNAGTVFDENIGLGDPANGPLANGTVENNLGVPQTVTANLKEMSEIGAKYRFTKFDCVSVKRSDDGKDVYLYYEFKDSHAFVVDFGLPVRITREDLKIDGEWTVATISGAKYGTATVKVGEGITYTPTQVMAGAEQLTLTLMTDGEEPVSHTIYLIPATLVYYGANDTFCELTGTWDQTQGRKKMQKVVRYASDSNIEELQAEEYNYGYDSAYDRAGNYDVLSSSKAADTISFSFVGNGVDIYADAVTDGAYVMVWVKDSAGTTEKFFTIDTAVRNGDTGVTSYGDSYKSNTLVSLDGLTYGKHSVDIRIIKEGTFNFAGFRVHNTITNNANVQKAYEIVQEENPTFIELRNGALAGVTIPEGTPDQVYDNSDLINGNVTVAVLGKDGKIGQEELTDLLNNGPKNELFVTSDYSVTFTLKADRPAQIGLHAATLVTEKNPVKYRINGGEEQTLTSSVDMFYDLPESPDNTYTITVTEGVLSITDIKVTGSKSAEVALAPITREAVAHAMVCMGYGADKSALEDLVSKAEGMDLTGYTAESVDAFRKALTNAQAVLDDNSLMKEDQQLVDDTVAALTAAMDGLTVKTEPQPSQKPEATQAPEVTQKPEETQQPQVTKQPEGVPQTGDNAPLALSTLMLVGSAVCVLALAVAGVKRRRS